ncbi:translocation/assembly module TamB [Daejeonella oryzae]|uniref:translocation/assembly module TamB n=1 Tax=Daejeonella oryzae TaxID=1122943 RepID=UPI0003FB845A|nr:translocation/assembly module TamB [Daejeonella oryzae]
MNKGTTLALKIFLWIAGSIIFLVLLIFVLIQVPAVQDFARKKTVSFLQNKLKTKVEIKKLSLDLPKLIVLEDVYFEDQNQDTLLAGDTLKVDISLLKLLKNQVEINEIDLRGITAKVQRTMPDSVFNFDYILKAFITEQSKNAPPADSAAAMKFSLDKINLDRINVSFQDAVTANDVRFQLNHFNTRIREFDLDKMKFSIPNIKLSGLNANIIQSKPALKQESTAKVEADSNEPFDLDLKLGTIDLSKIKLNYQNDISRLKTNLDLGQLLADVDSINLKKQRVALKNLKLSNTKSEVILGRSEQAKIVVTEVKKVATATLNNDWRLTIGNADFSNTNLKYDDFNMPVLKKGMDYAHLGITDLNLQADNFSYSLDTISGSIADASFKNKDGFVLNELQTNFIYSNTGALLEDLYIKTPGSTLRDYVRIGYPSLDALAKDPGKMSLNVNLENSRLSFKDVLTFVPLLADVDPFKNNPNAIVNINGAVKGSLSNMTIPNLRITGFRNTRIQASGNIAGLPDMNRANFNVNIREFKSSRDDLNQLLSAGIIPANIRLPESFNVTGKFNGGINSFRTNLNLNSSYGAAQIAGNLQNGNRAGRETFNAAIKLNNFNAGRLIKQEASLGRITADAKVSGTGLDPKYMTAQFSGTSRRADVNGYTYQNLGLNGSIANQNVNLSAKMNDQNLRFNLKARANIKNTFPAVSLVLDLDSANFQKLNLYNEDLRFRGRIVADLPSTDPDRLIGTIKASDLLLVVKGNRYKLDSINVDASVNGNQKDLRIRSEFLTASIIGNYKLTETGNILFNEINRHFKIGDGKMLPVSTAQDFVFTANITNRPIIQEFMPALTGLEPVSIKGSFNSTQSNLTLEANAPKIIYNGNTINNLLLDINSDKTALNYSLNLDNISTSSIQINKTSLDGSAKNDQLDLNLNIKDQADKNKYRIAGLLSAFTDQYRFSFNPGGLLMNYEEWAVSSQNFIQFGTKGILANDFIISNNNQNLSVTSNPAQINAPLSVDFSNFKIATLTAIAEQDSLLADGTINGNIILSNLASSPVFVGDLNIKDFTFRSDTLGDISMKVNNREANTYAATVNITGKGNDIFLDGEYYLRPENKSTFDFDLNIRNVNLATMEGLSMGNIKNASGNLSGELKLTGSPDVPSVRGDINFNKAAFNISMLNSYYTIDEEKIAFTRDGIQFDSFTLVDSIGNEAVVDGTVFTNNFLDYRFGLTARTENFKVLSSTKKDNKLFYGNVFLNSDLRIRGDMNSPEVDGSVKINKGTNFTVVVPQSDPGVISREGIVEFVDFSNPENASALTSGLDTLNTMAISGMDVAVNIEVDSAAIFNIVIDEGNGDFLQVQGDAQLTAGIDPSGKVNLTGAFQLVKGAYELSFNFIKRRFEIEKGSTINWQGEPTTADVNVTAIYVANTAPIDLVESQLDEPAASLNRYKQKLPFEVSLNMKGELMKPEITFDIELPTNKNYNVARDVLDNVQYRLTQLESQPSELNKQVFALLLLNRFVAENPFASSAGGGGIESMARNSVSKILSDQLNNLAGNLIEGVDLNFDLVSSEDYTTGSLQNRTDLNVGLSKRLLNDRLKVSIGSNFELEGPRNSNQSSNNIAGNVALDYQLSKDGRYMLRAYRKNEYQGVVEGYLIETGVGFIITLDYNQFKEIFARKTEEEKGRRRLEKESKKQEKIEAKQVVNIDN